MDQVTNGSDDVADETESLDIKLSSEEEVSLSNFKHVSAQSRLFHDS